MNYEKYLQGLIKRAGVAKTLLVDWQKDGEDAFFAAEMSYFIGYCLALEGLLEKDKPK